MVYKFQDKSIKIDDTWINKTMKALELSKDEVIQMYLEDEGYLDNEEQLQAEAKAKECAITQKVHKARSYKKKTQKERTQKPNPTKEKVIAGIAEILPRLDCEEVVVVNKGKIITFVLNDECYKIDLTFSRNETKKRKERRQNESK